MKIETETRDDHQVKIFAEIETDLFEKTKRQAARKISQNTKIPGFRPGKAPLDIVRRMVGEKAIQEEALEMLVDEVYPKVIEEAGIQPSGPGTLEDIVSTEPLKFAFIVPLAPTVDLGDYRALRLSYEPKSIEEHEVDQFIDRLRTSYATMTPVERPAQDGDMVFITLNGGLTQPEEGKEPEIVSNRPLQVALDSNRSENPDEWPFPGFSHHLEGLSAGDKKSATYTFPPDSRYENLRDKEVRFDFEVTSVKQMDLPEVNDEFAQTLGSFQTVEELRKSVRSGLESTANEEYDNDYYTRLIDQIAQKATVHYPPQVLKQEIDAVLKNLENDLAQQKMDLDTYLKVRQTDKDTFIEKEIKPAAVKRLERSLILDEVARAEKIEIDNQSLEVSFNQTMAELQNSGGFEQLRKQVPPRNLANAIAMEAASRLMNRRVLERLKAIATGEADVISVDTEPQPIPTESSEAAQVPEVHEEALTSEKPKARKKKQATKKSELEDKPSKSNPPAEPS